MGRVALAVACLLAVVAGPDGAASHAAKGDRPRLSRIGPAPDFSLAAPDGSRLALADLRGRVVAVTFIYASCVDACPLLIEKLVRVQRRLGPSARVRFVAITVDPERDTPEALRRYAAAHGAHGEAWSLLTGPVNDVRSAAQRYGVYVRRRPGGDVDHTFLTSLVDADGVLRVQYLGVRFDPDELLRDLRALLREARR